MHLRFASNVMKDQVDDMKDGAPDGVSIKTTLGFGPKIKLGVGYMF